MRILLCFFFWLVPQVAFAVSASVDHATVTVYYTAAAAVPVFPWTVGIATVAGSYALIRHYSKGKK